MARSGPARGRSGRSAVPRQRRRQATRALDPDERAGDTVGVRGTGLGRGDQFGDDWGIEIDHTDESSPSQVQVLAEIPELYGPTREQTVRRSARKVVQFPDASKAYQALSVLKECDAEGRIGVKSAAIVERTPDGELRIPEGADNIALVGTVSGSLIGMLIGVLGGPWAFSSAGAPAP